VSNGSFQKDAKLIAEIGSPQWDAVRTAKSGESKPITPDDLHRELVNRGITEAAAGALTRVLMVAATNARRLARPPTDILEGLARDLSEDVRPRFESRLPELNQLVSYAQSAAKALELALDHRRIFRDMLGPVFS
jgi:hypothetical protein